MKLTNIYLSAEEYDTLAALSCAEIVKERFVMPWGLGELVVDRFEGRLGGLVLAEAELGGEQQALSRPAPTARVLGALRSGRGIVAVWTGRT